MFHVEEKINCNNDFTKKETNYDAELNYDSDVNEIEIVEVKPDSVDYDTSDIYFWEESNPLESSNDSLQEKTSIHENKYIVSVDSSFPHIINDERSQDPTAIISKNQRSRISPLNMRRMCHVCGKIFKYPESLRRHLKTVHSDEKPFACPLCPSSFNRNHNLTIHIKVVHQRQRIYVKKHIPRLCDYCGKVLQSVRSLEEHISSMHTKKPLYECDRCHSTFFRKLNFVKHKSSSDCDFKMGNKCTDPQGAEEEVVRCCEICGLEFKKEHFYLKHMLKHSSNFECSLCGLRLEDSVSLREHVDSVHPEVRPFECTICHKKFKTKSLLNCHLIIHNGEKRYQCPRCSQKFLKKKYLTTHMLTHTGERPYICSICRKGFKQSGDMRKHKATHMRSRKV